MNIEYRIRNTLLDNSYYEYFIIIDKNVYTVGKREVIIEEEKVAIYRDLKHALRKLNELTKESA